VSRPTVRRLLMAACGAACAFALLAGAALASAPPSLGVSGAILIEQSTGKVLYAVNPERRLAIASTTKLMTALLTLEHEPKLGRVFVAPNYHPAAVDSQIGLSPGERMSVHDLLLGLLLPSGDDAAEDLAFNVGRGSVARFVGMMNARARELKLTRTHYSTPIGLDRPGNYSSAADLVKLASYLLRHSPFFARVVALPSAVLRSGAVVRHVVNRNNLVARFPWVTGVKTGHTLQAGYVLVGSGTRNGMTLISAVLGTPSEAARDDSTLALLNYGFGNFRIVSPVRARSVFARLPVHDRPGVTAALLAAGSLTRVFPLSVRITTRVKAPRELTGPLPKGAVLGTLLVLADGRVIARIPLVLARTLRAVSPLTIAARFVTRPLTLILIVVTLLALVGVAVVIRNRRAGPPLEADGVAGRTA
jgi:serine-type D-Ala-D-Ala carboxypeptidase (penicillin-binding protein 5/6)